MSDETLEGESRRKPYALRALFRSEYLGNQSILILEESACLHHKSKQELKIRIKKKKKR